MPEKTIGEHTLENLIANGVPGILATAVAQIIEKDDPCQHNLGRTSDEQHLVNQVVPYLQGDHPKNES